MTYCSQCGTNNPPNVRFCNNCAAPMDVARGPVSPQMPSPAPAASPAPRREEGCFGQSRVPGSRREEECFGQSRVPGFVIFAVILILIGVFSLLQWMLVDVFRVSMPGNSVWPMFAIALGILIIILWAVARRPGRRM